MNPRDTIARERTENAAGWRYEIQHGPVGETSYAWVYDDQNAMVCTAKTHHAIAIVQRMNAAAGHTIVGPAGMEKAVEAAKDAYDASIGMQPREYHQAWFEAITAAAPHMPVPAGWVLVPEEPSQDIVDTLTLIIRRSVWGRDNVIKQWKELLSTSSRPKGGAHG